MDNIGLAKDEYSALKGIPKILDYQRSQKKWTCNFLEVLTFVILAIGEAK